MLAGLNPSAGSGGEFIPFLFPCLVVAGNPWHPVTQSLLSSAHCLSSCASLYPPLSLIRTLSSDLGFTLNTVKSNLDL